MLGGGNWLVVEALLHPTAFFWLREPWCCWVRLKAPNTKHNGKTDDKETGAAYLELEVKNNVYNGQ